MIGGRYEDMGLSPLHYMKRARGDAGVLKALRASQPRAGQNEEGLLEDAEGQDGPRTVRSQRPYRKC